MIYLLILASFSPSAAQRATTPGALTTPYPTLINLAVEWLITGDDNLNATVAVEYRKAGEGSWHPGMPLRRIPADKSIATTPIYSWKNKFSGSLFDLEPGTEYEIHLSLSDPDGGAEERTVTARTRPVPAPAADSVVKQVTPSTFKSVEAAAQPGDILVLAPGDYGFGFATRDGAEGKSIVIRGDRSNPADTVIFRAFSMRSRKHVIFEGMTVNGKVDILGAEDVSVIRCTINAEYGISASQPPGAKNCYIADNSVTFPMPWIEDALGSGSALEQQGYLGEGIEMTGPGNVICYNRVSGYHDCISNMEDYWVAEQYCIDIYNNDIYVGVDDAIEADFCQGNCRIVRNRLTNCFMGLSSQPSLGGPTYFIRNVMYNLIDCPFKLARYSKGDVLLHNTVVKVGDGFRVIHNPSRAYFRNNLMIGGLGGQTYGIYDSGSGRAVEFPHADSTEDLDYDGVGTYGTPFVAKVGDIKTYSIEEFRSQTPEKHATLVDLGVFAAAVTFPYPPIPEREPADLRLKSGSAAVDAGVFIPNINDNFNAAAPDLGAYELDREMPHYGPRPEGGVEPPPTVKSCDFTGDGKIGITDVISMLILARRDPADPKVDWNGDGRYTITDAIALLTDILNGACPDASAGLSSAAGKNGSAGFVRTRKMVLLK